MTPRHMPLLILAPLLLAVPLVAVEGGDTANAVQCANLIYAGTRSSICFSDQFLSLAARRSTIATARKFKAAKLAESEVFRFPFAIMTGEGSFTLTDAERVNLRRYLERGGFLLASAGCSSKQWDGSFRQEMKAVFPDRDFVEIGQDHEVFRTIFTIKSLKTHSHAAKLLGLSIGDKIVAIYSPDGLNDTHTMAGCCCCGGNEIANSREVNANILAYALVQ